MQTLIEFLSRGGRFGHYWLKESKQTQWWATQTIPEPPAVQENIYFGVHPSKVSKDSSQRTTIEDIQTVNCLYADIDTKDYGSKQAAADHVKQLSPKPSVIVDSGGGYHCYWLFEEPFILDSLLKEEIARSLQERWVTFVGGDKAVHDLARILRVPGTLNYKYDPPRPVRILHSNFDRLYDPIALEKLLPSTDEHRGGDDDKQSIPKAAKPNTLGLQEIVDLAQAAKGSQKFVALWRGWEEGYASTSEADLALCCLLAFWTGGDYKKIDELFRLSGRMRDKWIVRPDYSHSTIIKALGQVTEYYTDPGDYLLAGANDEGNAQCVASRMRRRFLYNQALGWRYFQGTHWDGELAESRIWLGITRVLKERRKAVWNGRGPSLEEGRAKEISRAAKPSTRNIANCRRMLQEMLTVPLSEFDTSPDVLNCQNGVVDLRTGQLVPHSPSQRLTHCAPVRYLPDADQAVWTNWLLKAVGGRQEVVDYLQQAVGYSLTGRTREEVLFYLYGPARAGKGIFTETLMAVLGDPQAIEVSIQMFMSRHNDPQGFMLSSLRTTRFLAASESRGRDWLNEAQIKKLTGGNKIDCAFKGKNSFRYQPQFKIWLSSNVLPKLDPDDTAAWLRVRVISFPTSHVDDIDKRLKGRMKKLEVLEGVLAWAVEGAKQWYKAPKSGLRAPEVIRKETEAARKALDQIEAWLRDRIIDTGATSDKLSYADAFSDYKLYCAERDEKSRPRKHWKAALGKKGYDMEAQYGYKKPSGDWSNKRGWSGKRIQGGFRITIGGVNDA